MFNQKLNEYQDNNTKTTTKMIGLLAAQTAVKNMTQLIKQEQLTSPLVDTMLRSDSMLSL